ncbi:MAG: hypothetical protein ACREUA_00900 [Burkholderiales bacterium]
MPEARPDTLHQPILGVREYEEAIDRVLQLAHRSVHVFDPTLQQGGFNSANKYQALRRFLLANRSNQLRIVVHQSDHIRRECARLRLLLRQFSHSVTIHETTEDGKAACDPLVIVDAEHYVHRFHYQDARALLALNDAAGAGPLEQRFSEIWEASFPAINATDLGL